MESAGVGDHYFVVLAVDGDGGVYANPTSGQVVGGSAEIASNGNTLTFTQTMERTIINWQNFSIASGETTQFLQPRATSAVLPGGGR